MIAFMRNVQTGEVTEVQQDSDAFVDMQAERYSHDGSERPLYEQTGGHAVRRIDSGDVDIPNDLGYQYTPTVDLTARGPVISPDPHPERQLTTAEREAGIESHEEKMEDLGIETPGAELIAEGMKVVGRSGADTADDGGDTGTDEDTSVAALRQRAGELDISGRSSMNKAELEAAIAEHEG